MLSITNAKKPFVKRAKSKAPKAIKTEKDFKSCPRNPGHPCKCKEPMKRPFKPVEKLEPKHIK